MKKRLGEGGKMLINFDKKLYSFKAVKSAVKEYQNLADFDLKQKSKYIQVRLKNINKEVRPIIKDEFCNYILSLMKS